MDKDIVFDTCMQIRYNYDGCKKGMRPSGGRCVPARGRVKQGNNTGMKVAAGVLGAGALGTAIALPFALGGRKGKGAAVSEPPVGLKPVKAGKPLVETTMVQTRGSKEKAAETKTTKESGVKAAETKTTKESGVKATGRATPLTGRVLSEEEWNLARQPRDPSISLLNTYARSREEAEALYPQWFKPSESPKKTKKPSNASKKDSAAQLAFDAFSFVLSNRY